jgi:hypothetical protein
MMLNGHASDAANLPELRLFSCIYWACLAYFVA